MSAQQVATAVRHEIACHYNNTQGQGLVLVETAGGVASPAADGTLQVFFLHVVVVGGVCVGACVYQSVWKHRLCTCTSTRAHHMPIHTLFHTPPPLCPHHHHYAHTTTIMPTPPPSVICMPPCD